MVALVSWLAAACLRLAIGAFKSIFVSLPLNFLGTYFTDRIGYLRVWETGMAFEVHTVEMNI